MALGPIAQIHISVTDLERSVAFYRDVLGLTHLFTVPGQPMAFFQSGDVRLYLGVPESEGVVTTGFVTPTEGSSDGVLSQATSG